MTEIRFVKRHPVTGKVVGHYANPQSYAVEQLPLDHPDIIAFREEPIARAKAKREAAERSKDDRIADLEAKIRRLELTLVRTGAGS